MKEETKNFLCGLSIIGLLFFTILFVAFMFGEAFAAIL